MSINVTVTGNPVSVKRGKLVTTADVCQNSKEFQKRRQLRLRQVRQQSSDLAETVRNRVKKEKTKQLSQAEKDGATKLKEWQNRKLIELQSQYRDCLKDIGLGHDQAKIEEVEEHEYYDNLRINNARARERGKIAEQLEQIKANEIALKEAIPKQAKKMTRDIENARAAMVSKLHKNKQAKFKSPKRVRHAISSSSESEDFCIMKSPTTMTENVNVFKPKTPIKTKVPQNSPAYREPKSPFKESKIMDDVESSGKPLRFDDVERSGKPLRFDDIERSGKPLRFGEVAGEETYKSVPKTNFTEDNVQYKTTSTLESFTNLNKDAEVPLNTRISDRIKKRVIPTYIPDKTIGESDSDEQPARRPPPIPQPKLSSQVSKMMDEAAQTSEKSCKCCASSFCRCASEPVPRKIASTSKMSTTCSYKTDKFRNMPHNTPVNSRADKQRASKDGSTQCFDCPFAELPEKAPVTVRAEIHKSPRKSNTVQYYDHDNRFTKNYVTDSSEVHKISEDCVQYCPNDCSEDKYSAMTKKWRDDADKRGAKALEKVKIQKDYEALMQKLPLLQKQERIAGLDPHKDKFHMSDARMKEYEKKRQQKIESAVEKIAPNIITLPQREPSPPPRSPTKMPFKVIDLNSPTKKAQVDKVTQKIKTKKAPPPTAVEDNDKITSGDLQRLVEQLKRQNDLLMEEKSQLPETSNLSRLLTELDGRQSAQNISTSSSSSSSCPTPKKKRTTHTSTHTYHHHHRPKSKSSKPESSLKKHRTYKTHRQILILQNTSTQTSPKTVATASSEAQIDMDKHDKLCTCKDTGDKDKLCEILIKIQENDKPEIFVTNPMENDVIVELQDDDDLHDNNKQVSVDAGNNIDVADATPQMDKKRKRAVKKKDLNVRINQKQPSGGEKSNWKDNLTKNNISNNSSTSYYSPPDYLKNATARQTQNLSELLQNKLQQSNINQTSKKSSKNIDSRLLTYIKKLLIMSKSNIDDLGVSSVSEVSTPSSSVIDTTSNNPTSKLMSVLKLFNLSMSDLIENLNNTSRTVQQSDVINDTTTSTLSKPPTIVDEHKISSTSQQSQANNDVDPRDITLDEYTQLKYPDVIAEKYTKLADHCQKRIDNLAAMIQQVRNERQEILSPSNSVNSDKDNVTSYLNLPSHLGDSDHSGEIQKQLTENLLRIDSPQSDEVDGNLIRQLLEAANGPSNPLDKGIIERYANLKDLPLQQPQQTNENFTPVLMDIPKLPKLVNNCVDTNNKKRPPGLTIKARKFTEQFNTAPHELSTIQEVDSMRFSKSPEKTSSPEKKTANVSNRTPKSLLINTSGEASPKPGTSKQQQQNQSSSDVMDILKKLQEVSSSDTSSDKSEMDVEGMLKKLGMSWAIPTLRKTKERLAHESGSSSSFENMHSSSDVTLKDFVSKQLTSSADTSNISPFFQELQNISSIQGSGVSVDKQHRTSTPVQTTKSSEKSKQSKIFTGESDISSVQSDDKSQKNNHESGDL